MGACEVQSERGSTILLDNLVDCRNESPACIQVRDPLEMA
jgi:hypothetical protein